MESDYRIIPHVGKDSFRIQYESPASFLEISLHHIIRIPGSEKSYCFPPDCGPFPLYNVNEYKSELHAEIVAKDNRFMPIHRTLPSLQIVPKLLEQ